MDKSRPWRIKCFGTDKGWTWHYIIDDSKGNEVCILCTDEQGIERKGAAELIVKAVNLHEELVERLLTLLKAIDSEGEIEHYDSVIKDCASLAMVTLAKAKKGTQ